MSTSIKNSDVQVQRDIQTELRPPSKYKVILLNDDYTPMEFVVAILQRVFHKSIVEAERIMLKVHHEGQGVCGLYTHDVAATKVEQVLRFAVAHEHPLQCIMEPESDL
ncbi:MAG TPA: ATP-dependent Clp protease adapter ClpS [Candidatus Paenalcaligenes intestinipullorum]|uniref:ATP-dependent Clp protease adapter protein ClpS n=1 Tax=Candidatus Paenalcaligenes intestinipullorum TaxID=2838718 RepID=A0A9D2RHM2_9BURK|nr:ATP-dependent Clp protease adapter ClpS [Candidatus Paenalcaligenes intestinipullorum]